MWSVSIENCANEIEIEIANRQFVSIYCFHFAHATVVFISLYRIRCSSILSICAKLRSILENLIYSTSNVSSVCYFCSLSSNLVAYILKCNLHKFVMWHLHFRGAADTNTCTDPIERNVKRFKLLICPDVYLCVFVRSLQLHFARLPACLLGFGRYNNAAKAFAGVCVV